MAHGNFIWNELMTRDVEKAKAFYTATVGWSFKEMPMPNGSYWIAEMDGKAVGGMMDMNCADMEGIPPHWGSYLDVDDVDARTAAIEAKGGKIIRPPFDIPDVGRVAVVADPTGAVICWMTPKM